MRKNPIFGAAFACLALLAAQSGQAQPYQNAVQALNPAGYWPLNETVQPPAPLNIIATNMGSLGPAGNGYYGAWYQPSGSSFYITNNISQANGITFANDGDVGLNCLQQPGQYVIVPRNTNGVPNPAVTLVPPFTIEVWAQFQANNGANRTLVSQGQVPVIVGVSDPSNPYYGGKTTGWAGFALGQYQDYVYFSCFATNATGNKSSELDTSGYNAHAGFALGEWVHVVATFDGSTEQVWTNGVLAGTKNLSANGAGLKYVPDPTTPLMIGNGNDVSVSSGMSPFSGVLDEVAIYPEVLPQSSIQAHIETAYGTNATYGNVYTNAVLADSPILYYRLNDKISPANSGYPSTTFPAASNLGTLGASAGGVYQPGTTPGVDGPPYAGFGTSTKAVALNGFYGAVDIGGGNLPAELNPTSTAPLTVVSWFRANPADSPARFQEILGHSDSSFRFGLGQGASDIHFNPGPGPELQFANLPDVATNGFAFNDGKWHMAAGVSDGTNEYLYLDGLLAKTAATANGIDIVGSTNDLLLGGDPQYTVASASSANTIRNFDGQVAQVAFFTNALSAAQIGQIYSAAGVPPYITQQPVSFTNNAGSPGSLSVTTRGTSATYQWYQNGSAISGATSSGLAFSPLVPANAGSYYVIANSTYGSVTSTVAQVSVFSTPVVLEQSPTTMQIFAGASPTLHVNAAGPSLSYAWTFNSSPISGATASTYTVANAQTSGTYGCTVQNSYGSTPIAGISMTVLADPLARYPRTVLNDHPMDYFRLDETSGTTAYDYAGGLNGAYTNVLLGQAGYSTNEPSQLAATFGSLNPVDSFVGQVPSYLNFSTPTNQSAEFSIEGWVNGGYGQSLDAGIITLGYGNGGEQFNLDTGGKDPAHDYRFFVRDAGGNVYAATANSAPNDNQWHHVVGVCDEPNGSVRLYVDGVLSASTSIKTNVGLLASSTPLSIGSRQSGAGTPHDSQFTGSIDDVAVYSYALSSSQVQAHYYGSGVAPLITVQPTNTVVNEDTTAQLFLGVSGTPPLAYQWYDMTSGLPVALAGQTNATLTISNISVNATGDYYEAVVTNLYGQATSVEAQIFVVQGPPFIATDISPLTATNTQGTPMTYTVVPGGSAPFTYVWTENGSPIPGATNASLTVGTPVGTNYFMVTVSNAHGSAPSSTAELVGLPVPTLNPGDYTYHLKITFAGYDRGEALFNFPSLVEIGTNLPGFSYSQLASPDGGDIRFTDSSGTREIPHEIDEWHPDGVSSIWVRVPSLATNTDSINMYWGNAAATTPLAWTTNGEVWVPVSGSAPFDVVYHMKEGVLPFADSTAQFPALTGVAPAATPGIIGTAGLFSGASYLDAGVVNLGQAFTLSAWVNIDPTAASIQTTWANQHGGYGAPGFALFVNTYGNTDQKIDFASGDGTAGNEATTAAGTVSFGQWHLLSASVDLNAGSVLFFMDGANVPGNTVAVPTLANDVDLFLGAFTNNALYMHGAIDEARVQKGTNSVNWAWASYMTVAQNSTFENYTGLSSSAVVLSGQVSGQALTLSWPQGTLQSASQAQGPYNNVPNATSPWPVQMTGPQQFFRVLVK